MNYCIKGNHPDMIVIAAPEENTCTILGKPKDKVTYTSLVIVVDKPGKYIESTPLVVVGDVVTVARSPTMASVGGYLFAKRGELAQVLHVGCEGDKVGWIYAECPLFTLRRGWLEVDALTLMSNTSISTKKEQRAPLGVPGGHFTVEHPVVSNPFSGTNEMLVSHIHYCQDSIANRFQCGRRLQDTLDQLLSKTITAHGIPAVRIFQWEGRWHTEDNRRLWCYKKAGTVSIPVRIKPFSQVDPNKLSTETRGKSVRVRGGF